MLFLLEELKDFQKMWRPQIFTNSGLLMEEITNLISQVIEVHTNIEIALIGIKNELIAFKKLKHFDMRQSTEFSSHSSS